MVRTVPIGCKRCGEYDIRPCDVQSSGEMVEYVVNSGSGISGRGGETCRRRIRLAVSVGKRGVRAIAEKELNCLALRSTVEISREYRRDPRIRLLLRLDVLHNLL